VQSNLKQHLQDQHGPHGDAYGIGFLCGLQCNPETLVPSIWMDRVLWQEGQGSFEEAHQARGVVTALVKEWEQTEKLLRQGAPILSPLFVQPKLDMLRAYYWVAGFFDAAYFDGYDFIGVSEADQSAVAPFEVLLSAGVQRGFAGRGSPAFGKLQRDDLVAILRNEIIVELLTNADHHLHRAYRHFRDIEPIEIFWTEEGT
jgi:yecA family protein